MILYDQEKSAKAINAFAYRVLRRCHAAGAASLDLDDIKQELWIAYTMACEAFDPEYGIQFSTFLYTGMQRHINRFVKNQVSDRHEEVLATSLDFQMGEEGDEVHNVIPSAAPTPDQIMLEKSNYEKVMSVLSPRAKQYVQILNDQPEYLLEQVQQIIDRADYARSKGLPAYANRHLSNSVIFAAMGALRSEQEQITREVQKVAARYSR